MRITTSNNAAKALTAATLATLAIGNASAAELWKRVGVDVFTGDQIAFRTQGVTTDGTQWFFSSTNGLERTNFQYERLQGVDPAIAPVLAQPSPTAERGLNHIGDIDYASGTLYISLDSSANGYNSPAVALYNASDLSYTGKSYTLTGPHGTHDIASWVAVDAAAGLGYGMAYENATELSVYNLSDWSFKAYVPLSQSLDSVQGGKLRGDWMYMAANDETKSVYRTNVKTGTVEELFQIKTAFDQEIEGLSFQETDAGLILNVLNIERSEPGVKNIAFYHYALAPVPEPDTYALMLAGLGLVGAMARRRKR